MAHRVVAERLKELAALKTKVDASLEEAELLSLTGAAIGERYPKLLEAKEIIDKSVPALSTMLKETEITKLVVADGTEGTQAASNIHQSVTDKVQKRMNEILPESSLSYLRSLESEGVFESPKSQGRSAQSTSNIDDEDVVAQAQAAAEAFEKVYRTSEHPSFGSYGMVPDETTRDVWGSIPIGGQSASKSSE